MDLQSGVGLNMGMAIKTDLIDLHLLELRYEHTRIHNEAAFTRLRRSMEKSGQLRPVVVVPAKSGRFVLIDGYQRVRINRLRGKDTVQAHVWQMEEAKALVCMLAENDSRQWEVIEQAQLLCELMNRFELSLATVAGMMGKHKSWVKRRLDLVRALPEEVLLAVQNGSVSAWSAARILAPLARANPEHARQLTTHLKSDHFSTRQLSDFYTHYRKANRAVRENMISNPALFIKAATLRQTEKEALLLTQGPEGDWFKDLKIVVQILLRVKKQLPVILYAGQEPRQRRRLLACFKKAESVFIFLHRELIDHAQSADKAGHCGNAQTRCCDQKDQQTSGSI